MGERVVICGHGASRPQSGDMFIPVPKGCSISFYTDFGKTLAGDEADAIAAGTYPGTPVHVIGDFKTCPNLLYTPLTDGEKSAIEAAKPAGTILVFATSPAGTLLQDLFKVWGDTKRQFDFHWACCQALQLKRQTYSSTLVGSPKTGVNLTQKGDGFYQFDYTTNKYIKVANSAGLPS
jgi:hypothetical protein